MDIFNKKRVAELEEKLAEMERDRDRYMRHANILESKIDAITDLKSQIPEDCTQGPWCKACEFVKVYYYSHLYGFRGELDSEFYVCGKGESCKSFVQKEA